MYTVYPEPLYTVYPQPQHYFFFHTGSPLLSDMCVICMYKLNMEFIKNKLCSDLYIHYVYLCTALTMCTQSTQVEKCLLMNPLSLSEIVFAVPDAAISPGLNKLIPL